MFYIKFPVHSLLSYTLHTGMPGMVLAEWWPEEINSAAQLLVIGEVGEEKSSRSPLSVMFVIRKERDILFI